MNDYHTCLHYTMLAKYAKTRLVCAHTCSSTYASCNHNVQCGSIELFFFLDAVVCIVLFCCLFLFFFCRRLNEFVLKCFPRAAQFSVLVRPIKFLINIGVVIADPAVDANTHLSYQLHQSVYVSYKYPLCNFMMYWIKENLFSSCSWLPLQF